MEYVEPLGLQPRTALRTGLSRWLHIARHSSLSPLCGPAEASQLQGVWKRQQRLYQATDSEANDAPERGRPRYAAHAALILSLDVRPRQLSSGGGLRVPLSSAGRVGLAQAVTPPAPLQDIEKILKEDTALEQLLVCARLATEKCPVATAGRGQCSAGQRTLASRLVTFSPTLMRSRWLQHPLHRPISCRDCCNVVACHCSLQVHAARLRSGERCVKSSARTAGTVCYYLL